MSRDENTSRIGDVEHRVAKIEVECEKVEEQLEKIENKVSTDEAEILTMKLQVNRLTSHIESEVGTTNRLVKDLDVKLFGDGKDEYDGRIGKLSKAQHKFELKMAYGAGFVGAVWIAIEIYSRLYPHK